MSYYATPQRKFDGSPLRQYAQRVAVENPDSKHWEHTANETLRLVKRLINKREMERASDMLSPDWFERHTWRELAEGWQRVSAAAVKPLDAVEICALLDEHAFEDAEAAAVADDRADMRADLYQF
jgi:hypothetical protein